MLHLRWRSTQNEGSRPPIPAQMTRPTSQSCPPSGIHVHHLVSLNPRRVCGRSAEGHCPCCPCGRIACGLVTLQALLRDQPQTSFSVVFTTVSLYPCMRRQQVSRLRVQVAPQFPSLYGNFFAKSSVMPGGLCGCASICHWSFENPFPFGCRVPGESISASHQPEWLRGLGNESTANEISGCSQRGYLILLHSPRSSLLPKETKFSPSAKYSSLHTVSINL